MAEIISSSTINCLVGPEISRDLAIKLVKKLQTFYGQPDRYYHNFKHILQVISFLEENLDQIDNPRVAFWAALYHDIIYDTHSVFGQNEKDSAKFATSELSGKLTDEELSQISLFIKSTYSHSANLTNNDLCLFLDADISILGSTSKIYNNYAADIRKEYNWVTDKQYIDARIKILRDFLKRDQIFKTNIAYDLFETRARINMQNEINYLSKL